MWTLIIIVIAIGFDGEAPAWLMRTAKAKELPPTPKGE